jgi:hypothetical protein
MLLRLRAAHPTRALSGAPTRKLLEGLVTNTNIVDHGADQVGRCRLMLALFLDYPLHGIETGMQLMKVLASSDGLSVAQRKRLSLAGVTSWRILPQLLAAPNFRALPPGCRAGNASEVPLNGGLFDWTVAFLRETIASRRWKAGFDLLRQVWTKIGYVCSCRHLRCAPVPCTLSILTMPEEALDLPQLAGAQSWVIGQHGLIWRLSISCFIHIQV